MLTCSVFERIIVHFSLSIYFTSHGATQIEYDAHHNTLQQLLQSQQQHWGHQSLGSLSALVAPIRAEVGGFSIQKLNFLVLLSKSDAVVAWLLEHRDTGEFNQLLQVCRPSTDEPRILSSMASLTYVRTLLLQMLFSRPPYASLRDLLAYFREQVDIEGDTGLAHLANIQSSFQSLLDVFEKQTRSPGIKAFFDLQDILAHGDFVIRSGCARADDSLRLEFREAAVVTVAAAVTSAAASVPL